MTKTDGAVTLLALIDKVRECRRKQTTFRRQKNTENYKAMLVSQGETEALPRKAQSSTASGSERRIHLTP